MFAKAVTNSARFLQMPKEARLLYYDLGINADDDGVVEAYTVLRTTGATKKSLESLVSNGFVVVLNDDLVTYITDWKLNNLIRSDRYKPSVYADLLNGLTDGIPMVNQRLTQYSIGKDSIGKDSIECIADKPPRPRFVPPTVEEVREYCQENSYTVDPARFVDYYTANGWKVGSTKMKDWKATVRNWNRKDEQHGKSEQPARKSEFAEFEGRIGIVV